MCERARVCPHETCPERVFLRILESVIAPPVLCLYVEREGPEGKEKNRKTAPFCSMSLIQNPAKTSFSCILEHGSWSNLV